MVSLHNANAPKLRNFNRFMMALKWQFEDPPPADCKAHDHIKTMQQGRWLVAEYIEKFQDLACHLDWSEVILMSCFKDGLNDNLYTACITRGAPARLHDWCLLAKEVEIDQAPGA